MNRKDIQESTACPHCGAAEYFEGYCSACGFQGTEYIDYDVKAVNETLDEYIQHKHIADGFELLESNAVE